MAVVRNLNPKGEEYTNEDLIHVHGGIVEGLREMDYKKFYEDMQAHFTSGIYLGSEDKCV